MKKTFRLSMAWLHTWSGLFLGWLLFAIFLTGTATYFRWEITRWMQPEARNLSTPLQAAEVALKRLSERAPDSPRWLAVLADERAPSSVIYWQEGENRRFSSETIDPQNGRRSAARDSYAGEFFYRFHFQLLLPHPWGRYLAGIAAMFMFLALLTGTLAHWRQFLRLLPWSKTRSPYKNYFDLHNLCAVLTLPFCFVITYSALVIFMGLYMPWAQKITMSGPGQRAAARREATAVSPASPAPRTAAPRFVSDDVLLAQVKRSWGETARGLRRVEVAGRGSPKPIVTFIREPENAVSRTGLERLRFDGSSGALLPPESDGAGPATEVHGLLYGLHLAHFAGPALRWTFFLMGAGATALIATGLLLWTEKRRKKYESAEKSHLGFALVERLNIATLVGLPVACVTYFWANRLLPLRLGARNEAEVQVFLAAWALCLVHPFVRPVARAWREQLWLCAGLLLLLPLVDALTGPYLKRALQSDDTTYLALHATTVFLGVFFAYAAAKTRVRQTKNQTPQGAAAISVALKTKA